MKIKKLEWERADSSAMKADGEYPDSLGGFNLESKVKDEN